VLKLDLKMRKQLFLLIFLCSSSYLLLGQRSNIDNFTASERAELRDLMMEYITDDIVQEHMGAMQTAHNYQTEFLRWHRNYIADMEVWLENNGGSRYVPLPMWDPETNSIPAEFSGADAGLPSGNFTPSGYDFSRFLDNSSLCNYTAGSTTHCGRTRSSPAPIDAFAHDLECEHNAVHSDIGGNMGTASSPGSAIFWLYHAYIDYLYFKYDDKCYCVYRHTNAWSFSVQFGYKQFEPGTNWAYSYSHGIWLWIPQAQNACDTGFWVYTYSSRCGQTGWFWDDYAGDNWLWSNAAGGWVDCTGLQRLSTNEVDLTTVDIPQRNTSEEVDLNEFNDKIANSYIPKNEQLGGPSYHFELFPNSSQTNTTIAYNLYDDIKDIALNVYDLNGKLLLSKQLSPFENQTNLDVSDFAPGVYICRLVGEGLKVDARKLVVTR